MSDSLADILRGNDARPDPAPAEPVERPMGEAPAPEPVETPAPDDPVGVDEPGEVQTPDGAPPAPGTKQVPLAALEATRREKNDFKTQATEARTRLEERDRENAELKRQLDEIRRAPPVVAAAPPAQASAPTVPHPQLPNPVEDPEGYARAIRQNIEHDVWNQRLNLSEAGLRAKHQDVDEKVGWFKEAVAQNPQLAADMRRHPDPYVFAYEQGQRFNEARAILSDPAAYRARIEAEIRAGLQQSAPAVPAAPVVPVLPSSLASARSAADRSAPAWTGPESLADIIKR